MVVEIKQRVCDGRLLKWLISASLSWLEYNSERINRLNVFPVPDGDTGTNMLLTMQKAYGEVAASDEGHVGIVSDSIARGALMGARGNSGVILSQLLRGFAEGLRGYEVFDSERFARACEKAVDASYKAVVEPVEGTILTVAREAKDAVVEAARNGADLRSVLEIMIDAADASLKRTPSLLPVLKEAGVVDSGGMGLLCILEGSQRMLEGKNVSHNGDGSQNGLAANGQHWQEALEPEDDEGYGYDVQFLIHGNNMDVDSIRAAIDAMGWSTIVVGNEKLIKVHVHVFNPGEPLSYVIGLGAELDDIVVENMQLQYHDYVEERVARESDSKKSVDGVAAITVARGDGLFHLLEHELNAARVVSGGQTMNPSTEDFLTAIDSLPNDEIIILPNNKNIIMAAEQAASLSRGKKVRVIPSRTIPQGISALFAYNDLRESESFERIAEIMQETLSEVTSIEITAATRDANIDGVAVNEGQTIGMLDGKLAFAGDDKIQVVRDALRKAHAEDYEVITVYYGSDVNPASAKALVDAFSAEFDEQEFEIVSGGQPLYPYIISIE